MTNDDLLLENLDWVRRLARAIARDDERADDLVQETWLRARGREVRTGQERPWLARVMRNLARDARRGEARRSRRERDVARGEAAPSNEELNEHVRRREQVVAWVLELDEPYRRTMLLRWFEERSAEEIARSEDTPLATVRTRLRRGRELLRERAEQEAERDGGGAAAWLAIVVGELDGAPIPASSEPIAATSSPTLPAVATGVTLAVMGAAALTWAAMGRNSAEERVEEPIELADAQVIDTNVTELFGDETTSTRTAAAGVSSADEAENAAIQDAPRHLRVRVVDEWGRPAVNAPVAIFVLSGGRESEEKGAIAGDEGIADFSADELAQLVRSSWGTTLGFCVGLDIAGFGLERVPIDLDDLPESPVELKLPPTAALEILILDERRVSESVNAWLHITPLRSNPSEPGRLQRGTRVSRCLRDRSQLTMPFVQAGTPLLIHLEQTGVTSEVVTRVDALEPGDVQIVELVRDRTETHVTGRIVHPSGDVVLASALGADFEPAGSASAAVGDNGTFELPLDRLSGAEGRFRATVHVSIRTGSRLSDEHHLSGVFESAVPPPGQSLDVGAVVLTPSPLIASGRVVDADGQPVPDVAISLYEKFNQREDPDDFGWNFAGVDYEYTDAEGRFDLVGHVPPGEYALGLLSPEWVDRGKLRFEAGARDLTIVADPMHHVVGRLELPDGIDPQDLAVVVEKPGASREWLAYASWRAEVEPDGEFRISTLRPDAISLLLQRDGDGVTLARIDDVLPTRTPDEQPEGLDPWSVSEALQTVAFEVVRADGQPAERGHVAIGEHVFEIQGGRCEAVVAADVRSATVAAPGHLPEQVDVDGDGIPRVDLAAGQMIEIVAETPWPVVPDNWIVELGLESQQRSWVPEEGLVRTDGRRLLGYQVSGIRKPIRSGESRWIVHAEGAGEYEAVIHVTVVPDDPVQGDLIHDRVRFTRPARAIELSSDTGPKRVVDTDWVASDLEEIRAR